MGYPESADGAAEHTGGASYRVAAMTACEEFEAAQQTAGDGPDRDIVGQVKPEPYTCGHGL